MARTPLSASVEKAASYIVIQKKALPKIIFQIIAISYLIIKYITKVNSQEKTLKKKVAKVNSFSFAEGSFLNPLLCNVVKWSDILQKSCSICCKIFKVCLAILRHCEVKG